MTIRPDIFQERPCVDHKGNKFPSKTAMCEHWGLPLYLVTKRLDAGVGLAEALETPPGGLRGRHGIACVDHEGNEFPSKSAMCTHWGIDPTTLDTRLKRGDSLAEALEAPVLSVGKQGKACTDHEGNEFPSKAAMCEHWGIPYYVYMQRVRAGWDLESALTTENGRGRAHARSKPCTDHEGNEFPSIKAMCDYWGVNGETFRKRRAAGLSLRESLLGADAR